jgi:hypothetical protein
MTGDFFDLLERLVGAGVDFVSVGGFAYTPNAILYFPAGSFQIASPAPFGRGITTLLVPESPHQRPAPDCKISLFLFEKNNFSMLHLSAGCGIKEIKLSWVAEHF